ncbi:hypothetical protein ILUMI_19931 [Ignelater luminosus]|uniref:DDE-1 domain-containing protein n=1 Tax=Ignelater luminosus TaxID=2038154 RepID=A0A8K0G2R3_IGNLU|nr:hypothetical protein ILUMI_19931 [Ignelater luminosus]
MYAIDEQKKNSKTKRERVLPDRMERAVREILINEVSIRETSRIYNILKSALQRAVKKAKQLPNAEEFKHEPNIGNRIIFTTEQEKALSTEDWLRGFKQRYKAVLSLRKPEKTSLSRATAFNSITVNNLFDNLERVMGKYNFTADRIYNCDETGVTTVSDPPRRGKVVTILNFVNASGSFIPPVFIFPRVRFKQFMLTGAPSGNLRLAYRSDWMTEENFLISMQHFIKYAKPTPESKVLLLMDNHESHNLHNITKEQEKNESIHSDEPGSSTRGLAPTPEAIRPFSKAPKSKLTTKRRNKSTTVLTETPEMNQLKEDYQKKNESSESEEPVTQDTDDSAEFLREILNNEESDDIFENIENVVIERDDFARYGLTSTRTGLFSIQ